MLTATSSAHARRIRLRPRHRVGGDHRWVVDPVWWDELGRSVVEATGFSLVHLRIDPPVDQRYLHTTYLLDLVEAAGVRVVNRPEGMRAMHEKLIALRFPELAHRRTSAPGSPASATSWPGRYRGGQAGRRVRRSRRLAGR